MREVGQELSDKDIKYTLNSVISAADISKLTDSDKNDIINKVESKDDNQEIEEPISENEDADSDENNFYDNILNNKLVTHILDMADLSYESQNSPDEIAFDFCEAAHVFILDYNDNTEFINNLKSILSTNQFKPKSNLNDKDDLEYYGDIIYDALLRHGKQHTKEIEEQDNTIARFTASGGQTVGENEINERLISILNKVREKLNS